jgi:CheY-like chemotaxis protein
MKAVILDDDPVVLRVLGALFERTGYQVLLYESPLACPLYTTPTCSCWLQTSCPDCPDIIISDVDMPQVNGVTFIETLFIKGCKCRNIALLSGKGLSAEDMGRVATIGSQLFLKPLVFAEFESWLSRQD